MNVDLQAAPRLPELKTVVRWGANARKYRFEPTNVVSAGRRLFVDVSVIISRGAGSDIQRVVHALLGQLTTISRDNLSVQPIFATRNDGNCPAPIEPDGTIVKLSSHDGVLPLIIMRTGGNFLSLDLAAHFGPHLESALECRPKQGVSLNYLVYDLLPAQALSSSIGLPLLELRDTQL